MWRVGAVCVKEKEEGPAASLQTTGIAGPKKMYQKVAHKTCGGRDTKGTARFRFTQARHLNTSSQPLSKKRGDKPRLAVPRPFRRLVGLCPHRTETGATLPGLPCAEGGTYEEVYICTHARIGHQPGGNPRGKNRRSQNFVQKRSATPQQYSTRIMTT